MTEPGPGERHGGDRQGTFVHADAVVIAETGVLIRGASGAGKSRLVLALISMAEASGQFARLVGDDRIGLERCGARLVVRGHPSIRGAIEWRGRGIFEASFLDAAVVGLVIDLVSPEVALPRCPEDDDPRVTLAGVSLPAMTLRTDLGPSDQAADILRHFRLHRKKSQGTIRRW
jgi:HPr kinase/phosphorylase